MDDEGHRILWLDQFSSEKKALGTLSIMEVVIRAVPDAVLTIAGKSKTGSVEKQIRERITQLRLKGISSLNAALRIKTSNAGICHRKSFR